MVEPWAGRHVVYRLLNARGSVIYVGCTGSFSSRVAYHVMRSHFGREISRAQITLHRDRAAALEFEHSEIRRLRPRHNINGRGARTYWSPVDYVEVLDALEARVATGTASRSGTGRSPMDIEPIRAEFTRRFPAIAAQVAAGHIERAA